MSWVQVPPPLIPNPNYERMGCCMARRLTKKEKQERSRHLARSKKRLANLEESIRILERLGDLHIEKMDKREFVLMTPRLNAELRRAERLAGMKITPEFQATAKLASSLSNLVMETKGKILREHRLEVHSKRQPDVLMAGTKCAVCNRRQAQTQVYNVWLCKRCARGLDELPKGRA